MTAILEGAFQTKDKITSIDLPNSVTSIGEYAFLGCTGLTTIKLPDALAEISTGTFRYIPASLPWLCQAL